MITKGYIVGKIEGTNKFYVDLPIFSTPGLNINSALNSTILEATVCHLPGNLPSYNIKDVVYVGFEDNDLSRPIILGLLYITEKETYADIKAQNLKVIDTTSLSYNTLIDDISLKNINNLFGKVAYMYNQLVEKNIIIEREED